MIFKSTLLFSESFVDIGDVSPKETTSSLDFVILCSTNKSLTEFALFNPNAKLYSFVPFVSVCPSIRIF